MMSGTLTKVNAGGASLSPAAGLAPVPLSAATRSFASGDYTGAIFSVDGSRLFATKGGGVDIFATTSGALLGHWDLGQTLGGIDVSADGRSFIAVDRQSLGAAGQPFVAGVYVVDIATGAKTVFSQTRSYYLDGSFYDVAALGDGRVALTANFLGSGFTPLTILDPSTGTFTANASYAQDGVLTRTTDFSRTLFGPQNISDAPLLVLSASGAVLDSHGSYQDNVFGYNHGVQAIAKDGLHTAQGLGSQINIYNASLDLQVRLTDLYPDLGGSPAGLVFSPDGALLYLLDAASDMVLEFSTTNFGLLRTFRAGTAISSVGIFADAYGDQLQISPDGHYLSVVGDSAVQVIDLALVVSSSGGPGDDSLFGTGLRDLIYGMGGNDTIDGAGGFDTLIGGAGDDLYLVDDDLLIREKPGEGTDTVITSVSYSLPDNVENLQALPGTQVGLTGNTLDNRIVGNNLDGLIDGGAGNDTLVGGRGNDTLYGGSGNNLLYGGAGNDTYYVQSASDLVFEGSDGGIDTEIAFIGVYLHANVENLVLDDLALNAFAVGNDLANAITGNAGDNLLIAGDGNDTVDGGAGADQIFGGDGGDSLRGGTGIDYLVGGAGGDTLEGGNQADALYGEAGDDSLVGGGDFRTDILVGGDGNDTLRGDSGLGDYDLLNGAGGDDIYFVDTPADLTFEAAGGGADTVYATIDGAGYYLYPNTENLVLSGPTPFGVGNDLANVITAGAGSQWLLGGAGDDTLSGGAGNDVLFGEAGADTFVFARGTNGDVIGDFQPGVDKIDLRAFGFASFAAVGARLVENAGTSAIILGNGDLVVLNGIANAQLSSGDFLLT